MSFDRALFASKLKKYRERFEFQFEELSAATGITKESLEKMENSERDPTGDEVLILADFFKCGDYRFFISNEQLAPFEQTEILLRMHGGEFSRADRWAIQEFLFLCECEEFLLSLFPSQIQRQKPFEFTKKGGVYKRHAEEAAQKLRKHLTYAENQAPRDIYDDFRKLGFHIFRRKLENSNISGLFINHPLAKKCILINYDEDVYRQRFTAAHEAAHAILDAEKDFVVSLKSDSNSKIEFRANTFASRYLMPPEFLNRIPECQSWDVQKAIHWANELKVSTEALAYALKAAGLISNDGVRMIKSVRVPSHMKSDPELSADLSDRSKKRREELLKRGLSTYYVGLSFEAYGEGLISAARLAEILLVEEHDLHAIADIYGRRV